MIKKGILLALLAICVALFFVFDLQQWLTFSQLQASQARFDQWFADSPWLVSLGFFALYVLVAALSLPGATIMTLAAGALFGLWLGLFIVSFASSIGATLAFLVARYLFRDSVQARFGDRLRAINQGVEREGGFYLFSLRLVPLFPFFLINLLMGLTPIKTWTFYWVSQVGMLAGTIVYVNAGTQLGELESVRGIASPGLIISFILLGLFPLIAKRLLSLVQGRRVYAKWNRPTSFDRNLIVIGAGSAGLVSALIGATVKAKVTLVEAGKMGGDCLNYGCVPSKALIKTAKVLHDARNGEQYGLHPVDASFDFRKVMQRVHEIIAAIEPHDSVERYTQMGVDVLQGYATIVDPWNVEIKLNDGTKQRLSTRSIVIAAGAAPIVPEIPGLDEVGYVTSDTLWERFAQLDDLPARIVILGGGPIGCELSQCFARLGAKVMQIEKHDRLMRKEDAEVSDAAKGFLQRDGVELLLEHEVLRCEMRGGDKVIFVKHQEVERAISFDSLICAVGRKARLEGYGLEALGIDTERTVVTDEYLATLYPNIYAAGDVAGPYQFTHTASHQAWYAAVNALFGEFKKFKADYSVIPWTTFIDPEVARVGLSEAEAKEKNIAYEVTRYDLDDLDRAIADSNAQGFIKVLTPPGKDKILGVVIVSAHASDLLAEFVLAMKQGIGLNKILGTIHVYPTFSEANKYVAGQWKRKHAPEALLRWVEKYHAWKRL